MKITTRKQVMWLIVVAVFLLSPRVFAQEEVVAVESETEQQDDVEMTNDAVGEQLPPPKPKDKKHVLVLMYSTGLPLGDSWDYVSAFGWRGTSFEYRYRIIPQFSVGATLGLNLWDDKVQGTWSQENVAVAGTQVRQLDTFNLAATTHAWLTASKVFVPYLGLELGAYYVTRYTDMGWWSLDESGWHFGIGPELGFFVPANRLAQFAFSVKYRYLVKASDLPKEMFLTFNVGVGFCL